MGRGGTYLSLRTPVYWSLDRSVAKQEGKTDLTKEPMLHTTHTTPSFTRIGFLYMRKKDTSKPGNRWREPREGGGVSEREKGGKEWVSEREKWGRVRVREWESERVREKYEQMNFFSLLLFSSPTRCSHLFFLLLVILRLPSRFTSPPSLSLSLSFLSDTLSHLVLPHLQYSLSPLSPSHTHNQNRLLWQEK
jgi:hypothetical protein